MVYLSMANKASIGFIGLGNMGKFMAKNLIKKGHQLTVFDVNSGIVSEFAKLGVKVGQTPAEVAAANKYLVTMLPSHPHVKEVFTNKKTGILNTIQESTLCMDCSTIDIGVAKQISQMCQDKKATFVDSPVSGGVKAAENGTLTFMVGANSKEDFESAKTFLEAMGKNIVHAGPVGTGLAAKICNNMLLGISMIGVSEAMNLGLKLGLDKKVLAGIINTSSGRCWSSELYNPVPGVVENIPPSNNYEGGFGAALMTKDLSLAQNAAIDTHSPTPLGSTAYNIYKMVSNQGYSKKDFAVVYKFLEELK